MGGPGTRGYTPWPPGSLAGVNSSLYASGMADANSPLPGLKISLAQYVANGIAPDKIVLGLPWYGYDYTCDDVTLWQRNGTDVAPGSPCKPLGGTRGAGARQAPYAPRNTPAVAVDLVTFSSRAHDQTRVGASRYWEQMDILHSNMTRVTTVLIYNHTTVSMHYVRRSPT